MGQKVNPKSIRLKINENWDSLWFNHSDYTDNLISDLKVRRLLEKKLKEASVSNVSVTRDANKITVNIYSGRPGVIIGRGGTGTDELKKMLNPLLGKRIQINILEVKNSEISAAIIAQNISAQLEKRIPFRRAIRQTIERAKESGVSGIKIIVSGRLNGADIARSEKAIYGTVPLSTFKCNIEYYCLQSQTTYGVIGVKVWVYSGNKDKDSNDKNIK